MTPNFIATLRYKLGSAKNAFLGAKPDPSATVSYSQEGEDRILFARLGSRQPGFYVDIGAHHPRRFSNTKLFYDLGWSGINIDADHRLIEAFTIERPRDVNLAVGVGLVHGHERFHIFDEAAISTFDPELASARARTTPFKPVRNEFVEIKPLASILDEHLRPDQKITFLSVDVEGRDLDVLQSNDWDRYRPEVVLAESLLLSSLQAVETDPIYQFLSSKNYSLLAKTINTLIFVAGESSGTG